MLTLEQQLKILKALDIQIGDFVYIEDKIFRFIKGTYLQICQNEKEIVLTDYSGENSYDFSLLFKNEKIIILGKLTKTINKTCKDFKDCYQCPLRPLDCLVKIAIRNQSKDLVNLKNKKIFELMKSFKDDNILFFINRSCIHMDCDELDIMKFTKEIGEKNE